MNKTIDKFIYWTPRVLSIFFVLFLALFSLDVFEGSYGFWGTVLALFMHNIPALILLAISILSWKREIIGGIGFILAGLTYMGLILSEIISTGFEWYYLAWAVQISGIAFLVGILFLVGWSKRRRG